LSSRPATRPDGRAPCVIGVAQETVHPGRQPAPEPLVSWERVCRAAAEDAFATRKAQAVLDATDSLQIVYCQSWQYDDPPGRLSERLCIQPRQCVYSGIGGTTPQLLVQTAAEAILRGDMDVAIITGAEALETRRQLKKAGEKPGWSFPDPERKPFPFEAPFHPAEVAHDVFQAWLTFPIWDIARRAHRQTAPAEYRRQLGDLMAPMTEVAAANPYAWFPRARTAEELITATAANRMVGYPYTKYMVSIMDVDMAGAVIVASHERADQLGVPPDRRVYLRGWCYATEPTYVAEHTDLWASPAMHEASAAALETASVNIDDVAHLDLYSCFGSSLTLALDALGINAGDSRGVTVTGGLPFSGGAGSDYLTHSIATITGVLRRDPGSFGLVSGVGMHLTKHIFGLYSTTPPASLAPVDQAAIQRRLDSRPPRMITGAAPDGATATVASYTVAHSRSGEPEWGLAICDLPDGTRCYARVDDAEVLRHIEDREWVGSKVSLASQSTSRGSINLVRAGP
jgi:acetyl-CoA C-acetyltransferase